MKSINSLKVLVLVFMATLGFVAAQIPQLINYQGRVVVGTTNFNGTGQFKFALVNGGGTTTYWSNDGTSTAGGEPTAAVSLTVTKGLYSVLLGDATLANMTVIPNSVFNNADVRLRVWFNDGVNGFQLLTPDQRIAAVGYAMMAGNAATVADGAITSAKIANGAVGSTQLATNAVQSANIAAGAVGSPQLGTGAVQASNIASGAITPDKLAKPVRTGAVESTAMIMDFFSATFSATFSPAFATTPVVTLTMDADASSPVASTSILVANNRSVNGFTGTVVSNSPTPISSAEGVSPDDGGGSGGDVGQYASQAIVSGNPAISYYDSGNGDLKYVRATDASGTTWGTPVTIDSAGDVGRFTSLAVINGNPAISYYNLANGDLKYVRATDASGANWGTPVTISSAGDVGWHTSLAEANGNPAISYYDSSNGDLKYVRATNPNGTAWGPPVTIDSIGNVGQDTSLEIVNGNPAISYHDGTNFDLRYVRATDASGTTWGTPVTIDSTGDVGRYSSLAVVNGNPAISYYDFTNIDLKYVRATDVSGTAWNPPVTVDSTGSVGQYTSLTVANFQPAISYNDIGNSYLKYVRATDGSGTAWDPPLSLRRTGLIGGVTSLIIANGNPAIAHFDATNNALIFGRAFDESGVIWFPHVFADGGGKVGSYNSVALVNGKPATAYYDASNRVLHYARAFNAAGTGWIAPVIVDPGGGTADVGTHCVLMVVNGRPAICYNDVTNSDLKYVQANDVNGTAWGTPVVVDGAGGTFMSMAIVAGFPAISYVAGGGIRYVRASDADGSAWGTPVSGFSWGFSSGAAASGTSLAVINGNPALAYFSNNFNRLTYVRAANATGTAWGPVALADNTNGVGSDLFCSLASINGSPAIAYGDQAYLHYVRSTDASGTAWGTPMNLAPVRARNTSLFVVNGLPTIVCSSLRVADSTNLGVQVIRAVDGSGNSWGSPTLLDSESSVSSAVYASGRLLISAYHATPRDLHYIYPGSALHPFTVQWMAQEP